MPSKAKLQFIRKFLKNFDLVRSGKLKGIQLRLDEKPGLTIANKKRGKHDH